MLLVERECSGMITVWFSVIHAPSLIVVPLRLDQVLKIALKVFWSCTQFQVRRDTSCCLYACRHLKPEQNLLFMVQNQLAVLVICYRGIMGYTFYFDLFYRQKCYLFLCFVLSFVLMTHLV